ncbi:MAG: phage holin family protein [Acidobacteriales bacterium]|nr:phage holin family protein [Terriglobales bacterium]
MKLLLNWILSAIALLLVAYFVDGFYVSNFFWALIAAIVIGFINATLGTFLKILTFPLTILTLGIFLLVINALMLQLAGWLTPGFEVRGFQAAFVGAVILALLHMVIRWALEKKEPKPAT